MEGHLRRLRHQVRPAFYENEQKYFGMKHFPETCKIFFFATVIIFQFVATPDCLALAKACSDNIKDLEPFKRCGTREIFA